LEMDNSSTKDKARDSAASPAKKPYTAPSFRFEPVFEVSALSCGKTFGNEGSCLHSRKAS
jgi:hypothetical protein